MTCQHTMTLGVYLLGALDPSERSEFESHLAYCDICRVELVRLAPLPGLLNQITQDDFADERPPTGREGTIATRVAGPEPADHRAGADPAGDAPAMTPALPPVTDDTPRPRARPAGERPPGGTGRSRRPPPQSWCSRSGACSAGGPSRRPRRRSPRASPGAPAPRTAPRTPTPGSSTTSGAPRSSPRVQGLPPGRKCYLVVYDHYGNREVAGWWGTDHDPNVEIPASTSIQRSKISRLEFKLDDRRRSR